MKPIPLFAQMSLVLSLLATLWLRESGDGGVSWPKIGILAAILPIWAAARFVARNTPMNRVLRFLAAPVISLGSAIVMPFILGRVGLYLIPPVPDWIGMAIAGGAVLAAARSWWLREGAPWVALGGFALGGAIFVTAFMLDPLTDSPYHVVRAYAAASLREHESAMKRMLSSDSLNDMAETHSMPNIKHVTQAAKAALLLKVTYEGDRATIDCPVPSEWDLWGLMGHGGEVDLVREGGNWKLDPHRQYVELMRRVSEAEAEAPLK